MNLRREAPHNSLKREKNLRKAKLFLDFDFFGKFELRSSSNFQKKTKI